MNFGEKRRGAMSGFFTLPTSQRKRKRLDNGEIRTTKKRNSAPSSREPAEKPKPSRAEKDDSISGSDSDEEEKSREAMGGEDVNSSSASDHDDETGAERRLRLAERYLENIKGEVDEIGFDAADIDRDIIAERLKEDVVRFLRSLMS